jgi:hypothetical protein
MGHSGFITDSWSQCLLLNPRFKFLYFSGGRSRGSESGQDFFRGKMRNIHVNGRKLLDSHWSRDQLRLWPATKNVFSNTWFWLVKKPEGCRSTCEIPILNDVSSVHTQWFLIIDITSKLKTKISHNVTACYLVKCKHSRTLYFNSDFFVTRTFAVYTQLELTSS